MCLYSMRQALRSCHSVLLCFPSPCEVPLCPSQLTRFYGQDQTPSPRSLTFRLPLAPHRYLDSCIILCNTSWLYYLFLYTTTYWWKRCWTISLPCERVTKCFVCDRMVPACSPRFWLTVSAPRVFWHSCCYCVLSASPEPFPWFCSAFLSATLLVGWRDSASQRLLAASSCCLTLLLLYASCSCCFTFCCISLACCLAVQGQITTFGSSNAAFPVFLCFNTPSAPPSWSPCAASAPPPTHHSYTSSPPAPPAAALSASLFDEYSL